ncbi:MAG: hypothetical protein RSC06_00800 [Clostridia bacterium]
MALAMRNQWAAYMNTAASGESVYNLMGDGFTDLSESKNPKEYARKYIHEKSERSDVTGYAPALAYSMDYYTTDPVAAVIRSVTDEEKIGTDAQRDVVLVDLFDESKTTGTYAAYKRTFAIIPDGKGSGTDALIYTGNLKACGDIVKGTFVLSTKIFTAGI